VIENSDFGGYFLEPSVFRLKLLYDVGGHHV